LAIKSPILIVGDDDQALYHFKNATPEYLRKKAKDLKYAKFSLPYCSRCPEVIVKITNHIIEQAKQAGKLDNRINKKFLCYTPDKSSDSQKYPLLIHAKCTVQSNNVPYMSKYIEKTIKAIPNEDIKESIEKNYPTALIIGPSQYLGQIHEYLMQKFTNVIYNPKKLDNTLQKMEGYSCLLKNSKSNLGWRIIIKHDYSVTNVKGLIELSVKNKLNLFDILPDEYIGSHMFRLELLKKLIDGGSNLTNDEELNLSQYFEMKSDELLRKINLNEEQIEIEFNRENEGLIVNGSDPIIQLSTYNGCKGLDAGHVYVVGFDQDMSKPKQIPSTTEVCQFIVALTRTRKQCHFLTTKRLFGKPSQSSMFLDWLPKNSVEVIKVNKDYFK